MEKILFLTHTETDGSLSKLSLEALNAATKVTQGLADSTFIVGLVGQDTQAAADSIASCGASKFVTVSGNDYASSRYCSDVIALETIAKESGATIIITPATSRLNRSIPGAAARLEARIDTHISGLHSENNELKVERWYYRQRMMATLSRTTRPWFLMVDSGVFDPYQNTTTETVNMENLSVELPDLNKRTEVVGTEAPSTDAQTIRPDAKLLFVAGAGWTKKQADGNTHVKDAETMISTFLDKTQASLGSSKSLVDQGAEGQEVMSIMSHLNQVGQTGSTPRHQKGLATCCHGEEPHVVGWRFINERRAVNTDANCGWAQGKADVLYVADAFEVMNKLNEIVK